MGHPWYTQWIDQSLEYHFPPTYLFFKIFVLRIIYKNCFHTLLNKKKSNSRHKHAKWSPSDLTPQTLTLAETVKAQNQNFATIHRKFYPFLNNFLRLHLLCHNTRYYTSRLSKISSANNWLLSISTSCVIPKYFYFPSLMPEKLSSKIMFETKNELFKRCSLIYLQYHFLVGLIFFR